MELINSYTCTELATLEKVSRDTIKKHPEKYLPIRFNSYESKRTARGYAIRYVKVSDIKARLGA